MRRVHEEAHQRFHELLALRKRLLEAARDERPALQAEFEQTRADLRALLTPEPRNPNRLMARTERFLERALEKIPGYQKL
jgi:hypothetical protein